MQSMIKYVVKWCWRAVSGVYWRIVRWIAYGFSFLRSPDQAVFSWPEGPPERPSERPSELGPIGSKVALFVHFDGQGVVRPYVRVYLSALREAGFSVLFVTNAGRLVPESLDALQSLCAGILIRRNKGYDFAAMREGLRHFGLPRADTQMLLIANDSVYGPLRPLKELFARIDFGRADIWGATESWQARYHLQSYFLVAGPKAFHHPGWAAFWAQVRPVASKSWVISRYEVGFTQWMIRAGLTCAAIWPYVELTQAVAPESAAQDGGSGGTGDSMHDPFRLARRKSALRIRSAVVSHRPLNPTSDLWRQLLLAGYPFIKRELLRENPTHVPDIIDWRDEAGAIAGADTGLIERDLQRLLRNRAP